MTTHSVLSKELLGAVPTANGVHFNVWAPQAKEVMVVLEGNPPTIFPLEKNDDGLFQGTHPQARPGSLYRYRIDGKGPFPDPASQFQPQGVHGPSQVIDPNAFSWNDQKWKGHTLGELVLYELHVGTFTRQGTYAAAMERLPYLADLGITAIELMPLAETPGTRNWGYDGVSLFAPFHPYGQPDDLRRLVDKAHAAGLSVLLDVVYNHLGPDGNYLGVYSPFYFTARHHTPWGSAVNLDSEHSDQTRDFFIQNALQWIHRYHMDGLRLDATHAMVDDSARPFLAELNDRVHASVKDRPIAIMAEDCRNLSCVIKSEQEKGWGFDAVWSDDFHHEVRRSLAGDHEGYFRDFTGSTTDLAKTIQNGWFFQGQPSAHFKGPRGTDPSGIPLERFVFCLQNHDQIGNRAFGERFNQSVDEPSYRAASALLLCAPETPLLFMGQEWGATSPFLYFTDHHDELGKLVTEGRRGEFKDFSSFTDPSARARIPDPQAEATFRNSQLNWEELQKPLHAKTLALYQKLLTWRAKELNGLPKTHEGFNARALNDSALVMDYFVNGHPHHSIIIQWKGAGVHTLRTKDTYIGDLVFTTEDPDVCLDSKPILFSSKAVEVVTDFKRPGAAIVRWRKLS